jgi:hypothetical protein
MKILVGTPAFGGQITTDYLVSMVTTTRGFIRDNVEFVIYTLTNESLISRGRNTIANAAVEGGYDKLVFIDADIGWQYSDMCLLLNSPRPIVGGTYPLKAFPIAMNFNPLMQHMELFETEGPNGKMYRKTMDKMALYKEKYADTNGEVEVMHVPTGFMSINVAVLKHLKDKVASYTQRDFHTGKTTIIHEYFPIRIKNGVLESEDWAFCSIARENGIPVYMNANIITAHTGTHTFKP